jgi:predicted amidohydrolase YtcJ
LVAEGFSIHLHAIGDRAVRMALDAVEQAERGQDRGTRRHQIAHAQVVDPADAPRFGALGVIANFQPLWAYPDAYIRDLTWPALGPDRSQWIYPINAVLQAGGRIAFGSDWSVTSLVPLEGIQVAVTRRDPADSLGLQLLPEQAITLEAALRAYTLGAAYANGLDSLTGSLSVGKAADLVVLEADLRELPPHRIAGVRVLLTLLDGKPVHGSLDSLSGR